MTAAIKIGYTPTIEGAIGLAAVISVLQNSNAPCTIVDCDEDDLTLKLATQEVDIAVPILSSNSHKQITLLNELYTSGAVLCRAGLQLEDLPKVTNIIVASEATNEWKQLTDSNAEAAALEFTVEHLQDIMDKAEAGDLKGFFFIPTPCELLHSEKLEPIDNFSVSTEVAYIGVHPDLNTKLDQLAIDEMAHLMVGNKVMSALMWAVEIDQKEPEEAVSLWQRGHLIGR